MSQPYLGEIRLFAGNFAPAGWEFCDGQLMPISEHDALFTLIGTTYGGDGQTTFALPDLRSRIPLHQGTGSSGSTFQMGETGGAEDVTITTQQLPVHSHPALASTNLGSQVNPAGAVLSNSQGALPYIEDPPGVNMDPTSIGPAGGSQPHTNFQPYVSINYIISMFGVFPSQT